MGEIKQSRRQVNKNKVIASALRFFIKYGIENSKVNDIALDAGLTERSAFRYFENKSELVLETALLFYDKTVESIEDHYKIISESNLTGIEKIHAVIKDYLNLYFTARKEIIFVSEAEVYLARNGLSKLLSNKPPLPFEKESGPLAHAIKEGIKDGTCINNDSLPLLYYNTYDSTLGLLEKMAVDANRESEEEAEERIELFADFLTDMYRVK